MKKFSIIILMLLSTYLFAQSGIVKVTLKNGTTITGNLKTMNTSGDLTIQVAGQDFAIPMSDVVSIDDQQATTSIIHETKSESGQDLNSLQAGIYEILDHEFYPDSVNVVLGGQEITMILVRGGFFNMGFNGRHSLSMKSEPIHRVHLSSFYISKQYLTERTINKLLGKTSKKESFKPKDVPDWKTVQQILESIGNGYRLPTEAEWEYSALTPTADIIFTKKDIFEWCSDYFGDYSASPQINPKGCKEGKNHVIRSFSRDNNKWKRYKDSSFYNKYMRLVIDAKDLVN